jgi:hypothetical protein
MVKIKRDVKYLLDLFEKLYSEKESEIRESLVRITKALHRQQVDRVPIWQVSQTVLYPGYEIFYARGKT